MYACMFMYVCEYMYVCICTYVRICVCVREQFMHVSLLEQRALQRVGSHLLVDLDGPGVVLLRGAQFCHLQQRLRGCESHRAMVRHGIYCHSYHY